MACWKCPICNGANNSQVDNFANSGSIQFGDIVRAEHTSITLPLFRHMVAAGIMPNAGKLVHASSFQRLVAQQSPGNSTAWICLMTMLDKTPPESLQAVYQEFAIPIYRNLGIPKRTRSTLSRTERRCIAGLHVLLCQPTMFKRLCCSLEDIFLIHDSIHVAIALGLTFQQSQLYFYPTFMTGELNSNVRDLSIELPQRPE
ncbi:hypothetical protein DFH09DRAFT_1086219 [Mycena vulgaris]|nr:hypothetical protein DFH09DRAFT_1086219 [Mycena vulgaris]